MRYLLFFLLFTTLVGCDYNGSGSLDDDKSSMNDLIACLSIEKEVIIDEDVSTKHSRKDCPTGGWVGDGTVRTRCLDCDPPYSNEEEKEEEDTGTDLLTSLRPLAKDSVPVIKKKVRLRQC